MSANGTPNNADDSVPTDPRSRRIREIIIECLQLWAEGRSVSDTEIVAAHQDLMPELGEELKKLRRLMLDETQAPDVNGADVNGTGTSDPQASDESLPDRIGRYRVERFIGQGGFGVVYLGFDDQLERLVAIKVPHKELVEHADDAEAYLSEARTVANLDHPHIVPVYDVGSTEKYPCYVVSKYVEGSNLVSQLSVRRFSDAEAVELVATVAEALHYAHTQDVVHRDIKPGNILISEDGRAYVVDFGLALREGRAGAGSRHAGTPNYMSPEQARGEGHRVDGRSDLFSLSIVLYELIVGRRPFQADSRGELLDQIATTEPKPPRQIRDSIPKELERICLKALSKRAFDRYTTGMDMAQDLRHLLSQLQPAPARITSVLESPMAADTPRGQDVDTARAGSDSRPIRIVPKGLRSFDEHDCDFFLDLLPGPRDRDGLPESIRFWKTKIEETDGDKTFPVGLMYGPSGCGKSSLVRAGLLARLSEDVLSVYVEATPDATEVRLLRALRKRCPGLDHSLNLQESLASLRRNHGFLNGKKILVVLDQFEQWLHTHRDQQDSELVRALRQCDGGRVQCLVLVRDDFWMAATRLMQDLELRIVEAENSAAVDLFPAPHAEDVLAAFGRALGALPNEADATSKAQREFCRLAIADLAVDGKVISVRLALFAEMMKSKAWTPATLKQVGGTKGLGVAFLEETFSAPTAPLSHRHHETAARAVLKALLPDASPDIKGQVKTREELLEASGYAGRPNDFDDLMQILDSGVRLITPTDPDGMTADGESGSRPASGQKYYQLTHDYLIHSLRYWLTRKQKETRRGRAELCLAERTAVWQATPENRHLPSLGECLRIGLLTDRSGWTKSQRQMMRRAARRHLTRCLVVGVLLAVPLAMGVQYRRARFGERAAHAEALVRMQQTRDAVDTWLTGPLADLKEMPGTEKPLLQILEQAIATYESLASGAQDGQDLKLELARIHVSKGQVFELLENWREARLALEESRSILSRLHAQATPHVDVSLDLAIAELKIGRISEVEGDAEQASSRYQSCWKLLQMNSEQGRSNARHHHTLGAVLHYKCRLMLDSDSKKEAAIRQSLEAFEVAHRLAPDSPEHVTGLVSSRQLLGKWLMARSRIEQAKTLYASAIKEADGLSQSMDVLLAHELRGDAYQNLATIHKAEFDIEGEKSAYQSALKEYKVLREAMPLRRAYHRRHAIAQMNLGDLMRRASETESSANNLESAAVTLQRLIDTDAPTRRDRELSAICLDRLGRVYVDLGRAEDAYPLLETALDGLTSLASEPSPSADLDIYRERLAFVLVHLAQAIRCENPNEDVSSYYQEAAGILEDLVENAPEITRYRDELATVCAEWTEVLEGQQLRDVCRFAAESWDSLMENEPTPDHRQHYAWFLISCPERPMRDPTKAVELAKTLTAEVASSAERTALLGAATYVSGDPQTAAQQLKELIKERGALDGRPGFYLAMAQHDSGDAEQAKQSFESASQRMEKIRPGSSQLKRLRLEAADRLNLK